MSSTIFFFIFIPLVCSLLLIINIIFAPHNSYMEKNNTFNCGFSSFLGQNRTQFSISFFIFALLFLLFDLEILLVYPYLVSAYVNELYGLVIVLIFLGALTLGFVFELGKKALTLDSKQSASLKDGKQPVPLKDSKQSVTLEDSSKNDGVNNGLVEKNIMSNSNIIVKPKTLVNGTNTLKTLVGGAGRSKTQFNINLNQKRSLSTTSPRSVRRQDVDAALESLNKIKDDRRRTTYNTASAVTSTNPIRREEAIETRHKVKRDEEFAAFQYERLKHKFYLQSERDKEMIDTDSMLIRMRNDIAALRTRGKQLEKNKADSPNYTQSERDESFAPGFTGNGLLERGGLPINVDGYTLFPKAYYQGNYLYPVIVDDEGRAVYLPPNQNNQANVGHNIPPNQINSSNSGYQGHSHNQGYFPIQYQPSDQGHVPHQGYFPNQDHPSNTVYQPNSANSYYQGHTVNLSYPDYQSNQGNQGYQGHQGYQYYQDNQGHQGYESYESHPTSTAYIGNTANNANNIVDNTNLLDKSETLDGLFSPTMGPWLCGFRMTALCIVQLYNYNKSTGLYSRYFCNKHVTGFYFRHLYKYKFLNFYTPIIINICHMYYSHVYRDILYIYIFLKIYYIIYNITYKNRHN